MDEHLPRIARPCPLRATTRPAPGTDCEHCARRVHELDAMSPAQRRDFLATCHEPICVSYTRKLALRTAGLGLVTALASTAVNAQTPLEASGDQLLNIVVMGGTRADPLDDPISADEEADYAALAGLPTIEAGDEDDESAPAREQQTRR